MWYVTLIQTYELFWVWTLNICLGSEQQWSRLQLTRRMDLFFTSSPDLWSASPLRTDPLCDVGGLSTPRGRYDLYRETSSRPAAGEPFYKWWNDKNRKSYFLTKAFFFFFEKLRQSGGDGWGFKVTAVVYDCYWIGRIPNKCPHHSCLCSEARSPAPPLALSLSAEDGCVCVWPMTE